METLNINNIMHRTKLLLPQYHLQPHTRFLYQSLCQASPNTILSLQHPYNQQEICQNAGLPLLSNPAQLGHHKQLPQTTLPSAETSSTNTCQGDLQLPQLLHQQRPYASTHIMTTAVEVGMLDWEEMEVLDLTVMSLLVKRMRRRVCHCHGRG
jgi:hypothetical protein